MSFGRPGALGDSFKPTPPQRGSFPLDHEGECKTFMMTYLACMKASKSNMGACRAESRDYLQCRMDKGLMQKDDMANIGLGDLPPRVDPTSSAPQPNTALRDHSNAHASSGS